MGTFTVTDTPSNPYQGNTGPISLVNTGGSTIYLSTTAGADILNGFTLPPTGQMQWNGSTPLFAVCRTGFSSTLTANEGTGSLDANRASFWNLLRQETIPPGNFFNISQVTEVAHAETLMLRLLMRDQGGSTIPPWFSILVSWYDSNLNFMHLEEIDAWCLFFSTSNDGTVIIKIPVVGSFVKFTFSAQASNGAVPLLKSYTLLGTKKVLPYTYFCSNDDGTAGAVTAFVAGASAAGRSLDSVQMSLAGASPTFYLASLGQNIAINHSVAGVTGAGSRQFRSGIANTILATIPIAVGANNVYTSILAPVRTLIMEDSTGSPTAPGNMTVNVTWAP